MTTEKTTRGTALDGDTGTTAVQPPTPIVPALTSAERRALAAQHDLTAMGVRPPFFAYVRDVAHRWSFIRVMATSSAYAKNQNNYLGQLWALLNPILNATVYVIIFGFLLNASRGVENTIAFIVIGVFMFRFVEQSVSGGAQSIAGRTNLIRSLHFPRAVLPISTVLSLLATMVPTMIAMCGIVLLSGLHPDYPPVLITWYWLLLPVAVLLLWIFNTGIAFFMARAVAGMPDLDNVIGFVMRFVMYGSGVIFPVTRYIQNLPDTVQAVLGPVLEYQPIAVYLYLFRSSLTQEESFPPDAAMWAWGAGWAVVTFLVGFIVFWRGEERYGRD